MAGKGGRQLTQTQQRITSSVNQTTGEVKGKEETGTLANHFVIRRQNKTKMFIWSVQAAARVDMDVFSPRVIMSGLMDSSKEGS